MNWRDPHGRPRAVVVRFDDRSTPAVVVPVDDGSVIALGGQSFSFEGVASIEIEDRLTAELEAEVFGPLPEPGRPTAEWGKAASG